MRIPAPHHALRLSVNTGTVIGPAPYHHGYLLIRLDSPATYDNGIVREELPEIVEAPDNLEILGAPNEDARDGEVPAAAQRPM